MQGERALFVLTTWAGAGVEARDRVTNLLDVVMEVADDATGPLLVVARDILDAAADSELRVADEEELVARTDVPPEKLVTLLWLVIEVVPESDITAARQALEKLAAVWTREERRAVCDWAAAVHVAASDNEGVRLPARPTVLDAALESPAAHLRTSLVAARRALVERLSEGACAALRALAWADDRRRDKLLAEANSIEGAAIR